MNYEEKIAEIKKRIQPKLNQKISVKVQFRKKYIHGIAEKFDTDIFGGLDFGEHEVLILKQPTKKLAIKLSAIEDIR